MNKATLLQKISAAAAKLQIEDPMMEGTNDELGTYLKTLETQLNEQELLAGGGDTGAGDTGAGDTGAGDTGTGDTGGDVGVNVGGGSTTPPPGGQESLQAPIGGGAQLNVGGGSTTPPPEEQSVMVISGTTIETKRKDGTKLVLKKDVETKLSAADYELVKAVSFVKLA